MVRGPVEPRKVGRYLQSRHHARVTAYHVSPEQQRAGHSGGTSPADEWRQSPGYRSGHQADERDPEREADCGRNRQCVALDIAEGMRPDVCHNGQERRRGNHAGQMCGQLLERYAPLAERRGGDHVQAAPPSL